MNLPNKLTISRIIMTVFFLTALIVEFPFHFTLALVIFVIASITDFLDGSIARKHGLITDFGKLMDPLADKVLICSAFIGFIELGWMKAWMVVIIVSRELAITGLRLLAANKNQVLAAERQGKNKTITKSQQLFPFSFTTAMAIGGLQAKFLASKSSDILGQDGSQKSPCGLLWFSLPTLESCTSGRTVKSI